LSSLQVELITIGDELLLGFTIDTNAAHISRTLATAGVEIVRRTTVGDEADRIASAVREALDRTGAVITTGGLGPTSDDLTKPAIAKIFGRKMKLDEEILSALEQRWRTRFPNSTFPATNRTQAEIPEGARILANRHGTAPGIWMRIGASLVVAMPGVPSEMFAMFETQVKPRLLASGFGGAGVLVQRKINCFGAGESAVEERLLDLTRRGHVPEVGITVSDATISLRILARAANAAEAQALIAPVERTIRERLGTLVFGVEEEELQDAVLRMLAEKRLTVATAESVTAGLVAERMGRVAGASAWFRGGVVAYVNEVKRELLGVPQEFIDEHGVISAPVVEAMAIGCRTRLRSDLAVSTVGLAGPGGGSPDKPVGLVHVGLAWEGGVSSQNFSWIGTRAEIQSRTAKLALNHLRLHLLKMP